MTSAAEQELLAKIRRGENVTVIDHIPTIETADELEAFRKGLIENKRMTPDVLTAIYRHQNRIGASHSR